MRKFTLLLASMAFAVAVKAQTIATFESLPLSGSDTFYVNYSASGTDVGFNDGLAHFPCVYDTSFGGYWYSGFAYSNMTDDTTSGYLNQYAAITGGGYAGSSKYLVAYGTENWVSLTGAARNKSVSGMYITNSTYAHNSMRDGDFAAKKFGGTTGNDTDWFKLTIRGYDSGVKKTDSVNFYLADFRPMGTTNDSIIKSWHWVNLLSLGRVDSLTFSLTSSDTGMFGMNTPAYFCLDNFTTNESSLGLSGTPRQAAKMYPVPANDVLNLELLDDAIHTITITDMTGRVLQTVAVTNSLVTVNTSTFAPGVYNVAFYGNSGVAIARLNKQ